MAGQQRTEHWKESGEKATLFQDENESLLNIRGKWVKGGKGI